MAITVVIIMICMASSLTMEYFWANMVAIHALGHAVKIIRKPICVELNASHEAARNDSAGMTKHLMVQANHICGVVVTSNLMLIHIPNRKRPLQASASSNFVISWVTLSDGLMPENDKKIPIIMAIIIGDNMDLLMALAIFLLLIDDRSIK